MALRSVSAALRGIPAVLQSLHCFAKHIRRVNREEFLSLCQAFPSSCETFRWPFLKFCEAFPLRCEAFIALRSVSTILRSIPAVLRNVSVIMQSLRLSAKCLSRSAKYPPFCEESLSEKCLCCSARLSVVLRGVSVAPQSLTPFCEESLSEKCLCCSARLSVAPQGLTRSAKN